MQHTHRASVDSPRHPFLRALPEPLEPLGELSLDLRWTWNHASDRLWQAIEPHTWERTRNPWLVLQSAPRTHLARLSRDPAFLGELRRLIEARAAALARPTWCSEEHADICTVAYFSMEYGLSEALPIYSGGLGVLAGDHLKTASDLGVPLVAVGLLYQQGYFRQVIDPDGEQRAFHPSNALPSLPIEPMVDDEGVPLIVRVELPGRDLLLQVWRAQVGRVPLYLLDSNHPLNSAADRGITNQLYGGGIETRLLQDIVLGIGGWRALEALGVQPGVCHLNEGHAALAVLERARVFMNAQGVSFWEALWATRAGNAFTTHTPIAAAFDTFPTALLAKYGTTYAQQLGIAPERLLALGRRDRHDADEPFNLAFLAARASARINGVSRLHGEVSRRIFQGLYPRWPEREVPVGHITNGVHVPTWDSEWADRLWTEACGKGRWRGSLEALGGIIREISDETLWTVASEERHDLVRYVRRRFAQTRAEAGASTAELEDARRVLDPNLLTLGFARRFTAYKRPDLLLDDPDRLARILNHPKFPVQIIVAGKAHPHDDEGKQFIRNWARFTHRRDVRDRAVLLEDYDLALAQQLVQGVDLWINTPRRPWEASGTSGMKVLVNGGLNLSELDGWWAEAYTPEVGWAIGDGKEHPEPGHDEAEASELYTLLEHEIVPMFYARDEAGIPRAWTARIRASMAELAPRFSSNRMLQEYVQQVYSPAARDYRKRSADDARLARELAAWHESLRHGWHSIHMAKLDVAPAAEGWTFDMHVQLGEIDPAHVRVELYADAAHDHDAIAIEMAREAPLAGSINGFAYRATVTTSRPAEHFTPRVVPYHRAARMPIESALIRWWR